MKLRIMSKCQLCQGSTECHIRLSKLSDSAKKGCHICGIYEQSIQILRRIKHTPDRLRNYTAQLPSDNLPYIKKNFLRFLDIQICRMSDDDREARLEFSWAYSPDSDESRAWVESQLERCTKHGSCGPVSEQRLPTRLLDVGYDINRVRVVETNDGDMGKYFALSHCWGKPEDMTTKFTMHTQNDLKAGIPLESLPRTFRDAVIFTKKMGVRYLWIDSLCILQRDLDKDSKRENEIVEEDWKQESGKMCSIYRNSYLTLAATAASGCQDGLFYPQNILEFEQKMDDGSSYRIFARDLASQRIGLPLDTRGWAFQEKLLSPRTLSFGPVDLSWECSDQTTCQCRIKVPQCIPPLLRKKDITSKSPHPLHMVWYKVIKNYSLANLSHQGDKLAAIDGVAQYFASRGKSGYMAGLWADSLCADLLWHAQFGGRGRRTEQVNPPPILNDWSSNRWLFPTWSWASTTDHIDWVNSSNLIATCNDPFAPHRCQVQDNDPPYQLRLSGFIMPAKLEDIARSKIFYPDYEYSFYKNTNKGFVGQDSTVYCLRMHTYQTYSHIQIHNVILLHCISEPDQIYERIGLLRLLPKDWREGGFGNRRVWERKEIILM